MKVAVTQPNYLPWLGYFELLQEVDLWVSLDTVDLTKRSFIVRNRIKLRNGSPRWLSLRVASFPRGTSIRDARLADHDFARDHLRVLEAAYRKAPEAGTELPWLAEVMMPRDDSVAAHNERLVQALANRLGIGVEVQRASALVPEPEGSAEDKILALLDAVEAETGGRVTAYLNFATGIEQGLYDPVAFAARGCRLLKQDYDHPTYAQLGDAFLSHLSVVDLLLNLGSERARAVVAEGRRWSDETEGMLEGDGRG